MSVVVATIITGRRVTVDRGGEVDGLRGMMMTMRAGCTHQRLQRLRQLLFLYTHGKTCCFQRTSSMHIQLLRPLCSAGVRPTSLFEQLNEQLSQNSLDRSSPHFQDLLTYVCGRSIWLCFAIAQGSEEVVVATNFYRAMLCIRGTSLCPASVRRSLCHKSVFY